MPVGAVMLFTAIRFLKYGLQWLGRNAERRNTRQDGKMLQDETGRVYRSRNGDKCIAFLHNTAHVAKTALRQVHVRKPRRNIHTGSLSPEGREGGR